jgi:hypothetical protein
MSKEYWFNACSSAISEPLQGPITYWGAAVVSDCNQGPYCTSSRVSFSIAIMFSNLLFFQSTAFAVCAASSGCMFVKWWRLSVHDRSRVWKHYGWFSGLMCVGCCLGLVSYEAWAQWLAAYYLSDYGENGLEEGSPKFFDAVAAYARVSSSFPHQCLLVYSTSCFKHRARLIPLQALRWLVVHSIIYPLAFCCLVSSNLLVFDRLMEFSKLRLDSSRWHVLGRLLVAAVFIGTVVGLCANVAASVFFIRASEIFDSIIARNASSDAWSSHTLSQVPQGTRLQAVYNSFETIFLLLIVTTIPIVGVASARRVRAALQFTETKSREVALSRQSSRNKTFTESRLALPGSEDVDVAIHFFSRLKCQITVTCVVVFASLLIRAAYTTFFTVLTIQQNGDAYCPPTAYINRCTRACYNEFSHKIIYVLYTPHLFFSGVLCYPAAMLVSLWGMTSQQLLEVLRAKNGAKTPGPE